LEIVDRVNADIFEFSLSSFAKFFRCKMAIKILRKFLQEKKSIKILKAILILESLIKNSNMNFHNEMAKKHN